MNKGLSRWNKMTEEQKIRHCLIYAQSAKQSFLFENEPREERCAGLSEYCDIVRAQIDWISIKLNEEPLPLYSGPGRNNAKDFHDNLNKEKNDGIGK